MVFIVFIVAGGGGRFEAAKAVKDGDDETYRAYVESQRKKTDTVSGLASGQQAHLQWTTQVQIQSVTTILRARVKQERVKGFGLCHGSRSGREAVWFRAAWPGEQVWGTEISPVAASTAPWTMPWDYHHARPEWRGQADFVYSNALDHSFNASLAVSRWLEQTHDAGAVVIHWSGTHYHAVTNEVDRFGASNADLRAMLCGLRETYGDLTVENVSLPRKHDAPKYRKIDHFALVIMRAGAYAEAKSICSA
tara:strand:+ start:154 stop:903 length:750 start_codon:yes stop_codon:yes gene_type:complete